MVYWSIQRYVAGLPQSKWLCCSPSPIAPHLTCFLVSVLFSALCSTLAFAQTSSSDLEQLQKRQDDIFRERQREQQTPRPDVRLDADLLPSPDHIPDDESPCFVIREIRLTAINNDNEKARQASKNFQWALNKILYPKKWYGTRSYHSELLGKCYGVQGINIIMKRLQNVIVERGYVTTRIVAGPQDLNSGILELTVIPGRIRKIRSDRNIHLLPLKAGDLLNLRHIEQALENLKSLPSVQTDIQIVPATGEGAKPGESDLVILWQQERPWRLGVSVDDSGSQTTGEHQGTLSFSYDDLANINDSLHLSLGHDLGKARPGDGGTESYSIRYSIPIKNWAWSLSASKNEFHQTIEGAYSDSEYSGESHNTSLSSTRLLFRNQRRRINAGIGLWMRESNNFIESVEVNNQSKEAEGYRIQFSHREFIGRSVLNSNIVYHQVTHIDDQSLTLSSDDNDPTPAWLTADISLDLPFSLAGTPMRYFSQIRYQDHFAPLSSQDYFSIGNRYKVRTGNNSSGISAERGWMIRNDIETARPISWAILFIGFDYGEVGGNSFQPEWDRLSARTIGFRGRLKGLSYEFSSMKAVSKPDEFQDTDDQVQFSLNYQF